MKENEFLKTDLSSLIQDLSGQNKQRYLSEGLSSNMVKNNALNYGINSFSQPKKRSIPQKIFDIYTHPLNLLLLIASILSFGIFMLCQEDKQSLYLGFGIILVSFLNTAIEFYQEYTTNAILKGFANMIPTKCKVLRDANFEEVMALDVVVGDLVYCKMGDKVAADIRLLEVNNIKVDNSSITGESFPIVKCLKTEEKDLMHAKNMLLSGNLIVDGDGKGIVVSVGDNTILGKIALYTLTKDHSKSELTDEIEGYVKKLGIIAILTSLIFYCIARYNGYQTVDNLALCVGIFIAFVPQGLPATVTILMTISAKKLAKNNLIVKDLRTIETLGSISLLATDKTGTLTHGKMKCQNVWNGTDTIDIDVLNRDCLKNFAKICLMTSKIVKTENNKILGDPTEIALHHFGVQFSDKTDFILVKQILFNSDTKYQTSFFSEKNYYRIVTKGAPERILRLCESYRDQTNNKKLDSTFKFACQQIHDKFASEGQRVIAIAEMLIHKEHFDLDSNFLPNKFTFIALISIFDPPKPDAKNAIMQLRMAGIQVIMITGDHPLTAEFIARKTYLLSQESSSIASPAEIISGDDLDEFTTSDWRRVLSKKELVFARTTPKQKLLIIEKFQDIGHIVGMCGDGVNDSPALKKSNLGISMGQTGSEVSKEASSMIILDDNFSHIVEGVLEGRLIFANLKKSIKYILSHITPQILPYLLFVSVGIPSPMSTILLMFIDLFTEFFPAIFLAYEEPEINIMLEQPRKIDKIKLNSRSLGLKKSAYEHYMEYNSNCIFEIEKNKIIDRNLGEIIIPGVSIVNHLRVKPVGQSLCDSNLLSWSYLEAGLFITIGGMISFFSVLINEEIPTKYLVFSSHTYFNRKSPDINAVEKITNLVQLEILYKAQSAYFMSILIGQSFNLLACKRDDFFNRKLFKNKAPIIGSFFGLFFGYVIIYTSFCNKYLFSRPVEMRHFVGPILINILLLIWNVTRKKLKKRVGLDRLSDIDSLKILK